MIQNQSRLNKLYTNKPDETIIWTFNLALIG